MVCIAGTSLKPKVRLHAKCSARLSQSDERKNYFGKDHVARAGAYLVSM